MERRLNRRIFVDPEDQKKLLIEEAIRNNKNVSFILLDISSVNLWSLRTLVSHLFILLVHT
jgi:hypothetical protein